MLRFLPIFLFCVTQLFCGVVFANDLSVKNILEKKCSICHNKNETVPFELNTYTDVLKYQKMIAFVIQNNIMPPWPADRTFVSYQNDKSLSPTEKSILLNWIKNGCPKTEWGKDGDSLLVNQISSEKIDLSIHMPKPFLVSARSEDEFRWFPVTYNFDKTIAIKAIRLRSNNTEILHHCELFKIPKHKAGQYFEAQLDTSPYIAINNSVKEKRGMSFYADKEFVTGRFPGAKFQHYPKGVANIIADTNMLIYYTHYSAYPKPSLDSSWIEVVYSKDSSDRPFIEFGVHAFQSLVNKPFIIEPDSVKTFYCVKELDTSLSVFSCLPHAHHLCTKMLAIAITPNNDTVPIIKIDKWNFDWQWVYEFKKYLILEKGTKIHFWATYDNSERNPFNPFSPPQLTNLSFDAKDEMMTLFLQAVHYRNGDENRNLEFD